MSEAVPAFEDPLARWVSVETQRLAAQRVQEVFAGTFRLSVDGAGDYTATLAEVEQRCHQWCVAGATPEAQALRRALLIGGLDQWGLAYSQAFGVQAIPALSTLIGSLRTRLDAESDARFQQFFAALEAQEMAAVDFKIALRRDVHLALWGAMAACETVSAAEDIIRTLGGLMLALLERMPTLGWRLVADALASIQVALLNDPKISAVAQEGTQQLLDALRQALPEARYQSIMAHATQAVLGWQQARRAERSAAGPAENS